MAKSSKLITKNDMKKFIKKIGEYHLTKDILTILYKEIYGTAGAGLNKEELWKLICKKSDLIEIYNRYKNKFFGISTFDIEEMLNIDQHQRKKLQKKDILKVAYTMEVKTSGRFCITVPYYSLEHLNTLNKEEFYKIAETCKKKQATEKQLEALKKAREISIKNRTCNRCGIVVGNNKELTEEKLCNNCDSFIYHQNKVKKKVKEIFNNKDKYIILDTETTGLDYDDTIIELGVINLDGEILLNTRIKTDKEIHPEAYYVHGISKEDLKNEPEFSDIKNKLSEILENKTVLIYNSDFDIRMLHQSGYDDNNIKSICLMNLYMEYQDHDRWISLTNAMSFEGVDMIQDHSAIGDCQCCLEVLKAINNNE